MSKYYFKDGQFVIEDYDQQKTFTSFLPGIAGLKGIPIWAFYVNRGQGIASFGVQDKNGAIMEFSPANVAYQNVSRTGFRTFIKINGQVYEPFGVHTRDKNIHRQMKISQSQFAISEINNDAGYQIDVTYFGLPQEPFAALVRTVQIKNIHHVSLEFEVVDGMPQLLPYGIDYNSTKWVSNLMQSWMEVEKKENIAFYRLRSTTDDSAEVGMISRGNFYYSFTDDGVVEPLVDPKLIFGYDTSLTNPIQFIKSSIDEIQKMKELRVNQLPAGLTLTKKTLKENETITIYTLIGQVADFQVIQNMRFKFTPDYIKHKQKECHEIIQQITDDISTKTSSPIFDAYSRQSYLDNILRGGYPIFIDNKNKGFIYYVYSRKHGDLERDYNWFETAPEFYSQGNGNFRDMNQNRRNDALFHPYVGTHNIKTFMNLIQMNGYNPLSVNGTTFTINPSVDLSKLVQNLFASHLKEIYNVLSGKFTIGQLINYIHIHNVQLKTSEEDLLREVMSKSTQHIEANFGEGYWIDHWTYNLDLIESYLMVYPEKKEELMFHDHTYRYFDTPIRVLPRKDKHVLTNDGRVRQYGSIIEDQEKMEKLGMSLNETNWLKTSYGLGDIYETSLYIKCLSLIINKFATLDPEGMGIEMEANKPGWNDAMNGLPGLFGSGLSETLELKRLIEFVLDVSKEYRHHKVSVPEELFVLMTQINQSLEQLLTNQVSQFAYWNDVNNAKEAFWEKTRFGISGVEEELSVEELIPTLERWYNKIINGINKAKEMGKGIYPTYYVYDVTDYELIKNEKGELVYSHYDLPTVRVKAFKVRLLPYFLEAPARSLKVINDDTENRLLHQKILDSEIYDKKLKMFKTSESLENETIEIGRIRAFTPGWLERESVFLHMTYKYLLGLLKAELYDEFFEALKTNLIPFINPSRYGRSTLENSSFLASSAHPDEKIHGQGFMPRLSGSSAEFLSMWVTMFYGKNGFIVEDDKLVFEFAPILPGWLFDEKGEIKFKLLGHTNVTYINPTKKNTYDESLVIERIEYEWHDERYIKYASRLSGEDAYRLRRGELNNIRVYFGKNN